MGARDCWGVFWLELRQSFRLPRLAAELRPVQLAHFALDVPLVPVDLEETPGVSRASRNLSFPPIDSR